MRLILERERCFEFPDISLFLTEVFIPILDHLSVSYDRSQVRPLQLTLCRNFSSVSIDVCVRISIDCCCVRNGLIDGILCLDDDWPNSELFEPPHELRDDVSDCCADDNSCESD